MHGTVRQCGEIMVKCEPGDQVDLDDAYPPPCLHMSVDTCGLGHHRNIPTDTVSILRSDEIGSLSLASVQQYLRVGSVEFHNVSATMILGIQS